MSGNDLNVSSESHGGRVSAVTKLSCPINHAVAAFADKWKILIILSLQDRTIRYGALLKMLDGIAPKVMARQLRSLEKDGIVRRTAYAEVPPRVEYSLTQAGRTLLPILNDLQRWVIANATDLGIDLASAHTQMPSNNETCSESAGTAAMSPGESFRTFPTAVATG